MPSALKRKQSPGLEDQAEPSKRRFAEVEDAPQTDNNTQSEPEAPIPAAPSNDTPAATTTAPSSGVDERKARFAALRARNTDSRKANMKATAAEIQHSKTDPLALAAARRRADNAEEKLLKTDAEDAGEDFERKRAWDWTVEESEKWDRKLEKKAKHRETASFASFHDDARKVYKRQLREMKPDREAYEREKMAMIERAAAGGGLEVVETADGELIAVDRDGSFYSTADSTEFVHNRPSKENIDKLVGEIRKAEEVRNQKRKARTGKDDDDADVTYINDKNKQFNQKLARFYNKYTAEIRESFERGTAL